MKLISATPSKTEARAAIAAAPGAHDRFGFRGNLANTRYGWLRLTPAYSVHLVRELLQQRTRPELPVLDPFCGTGTTLLACAELGIPCTTLDANPFLVWLARAKSSRFSAHSRGSAELLLASMARAAQAKGKPPWLPPLFQIEKWWPAPTLHALGRAFAVLREARAGRPARDLATLAFCRCLIRCANVSFGHQSMSFTKGGRERIAAGVEVAKTMGDAFAEIARAASVPLAVSERHVVLGDARSAAASLNGGKFGLVVTSPPYANRMSYVRELRPYMYWLGYLARPSDAGELDWQAIGGTWGSATSRVAVWQAPGASPLHGLERLCTRIAERSAVLSRYVLKYFHDMHLHLRSVAAVLASGARVHYVVGNSKFFDVVLPVESLLAELLESSGFHSASVRVLRKRTSKRELFEYLLSATKR